jgi:hypothetical protein
MRASGAIRVALLAIAPLLIAASDPKGDVTGCRGGAGSGAPDLVEVRGEIVELGTSARWKLTFAQPLVVPDTEGRPFRIDIVIRDPEAPVLSFGYYRSVNRLVRVDATIEHETEIYLLPERASNVFNPPIIEGTSMTIQVPGRTLSADEDLTGTSPGLEALRWTVIVRDEGACDFLGTGHPTQRLVVEEPQQTPVAEAPTPEAAAAPAPSRVLSWRWLGAGVVALLLVGIGAYVTRRAR